MNIPNGEYFKEDTHEYFIDGVKYPSVTDIAKPISFERLDALQKSVLDRAKMRGQIVHELCEEYLLCGEIDENAVESEILPYIASFIEWARTYNPIVLFTEKRLFSANMGYCGCLDLLCYIDDKLTLIDYKTTSAIDKKSLSVQLSGYEQLVYHCLGKKVEQFMVLHLKKNGYTYKEIAPNLQWFNILKAHSMYMNTKEK